tara:strand:- start:407 stop:664 length:258 start_codon:yes stop_codon:yes gene_type:complete
MNETNFRVVKKLPKRWSYSIPTFQEYIADNFDVNIENLECDVCYSKFHIGQSYLIGWAGYDEFVNNHEGLICNQQDCIDVIISKF